MTRRSIKYHSYMLRYLGTQEQSRRSKREKKKKKKKDKYRGLRIELRRLWDKPVKIVPLIVGALGTIPKSLKKKPSRAGS